MYAAQRIEELLRSMTFEEKVGQCCQFPLLGDERQLMDCLTDAQAGSVVLAYTGRKGSVRP